MEQNHGAFVDTNASWSSRPIVDILTHHISPALWTHQDEFACRTVCRAWRDAFGIPDAIISPERVQKDPNMFSNICATCKRFRLIEVDADLESQFFSAVQRNPNVEYIDISDSGEMNMERERAKAVSDILRLNLPKLDFFGLKSKLNLDPESSKDIFQALQDTKSPLKTVDLGCSALGDAGSSAVYSALRHSSTVQNLSLLGCELSSGNQPDLIDFINVNTSVRSLNLQHNWQGPIDSGSAEAFSRALERNTSLRVLDMSYCTISGISHIFSALRSNKALRSLRLYSCSIPGEDMPFIFNCLCDSKALECLEISFLRYDGAPVVLERFFRTNKTLKRLAFHMEDSKSIDFAPMFDGLAQNTSLTDLDFPPRLLEVCRAARRLHQKSFQLRTATERTLA
jgi:hypothetical protein